MISKKFKIGDKVRIVRSGHETTIHEIVGKWYRLEIKCPDNCCNYYAAYELELIK